MSKHKNNKCLKCENMNLKNWKQFSDEVDEYNKKIVMEGEKLVDDWKQKQPKIGWAFTYRDLIETQIWLASLPNLPKTMEKSITNYLEWECGKLIIKTTPL